MLGTDLPLATALPFVALLLVIALAPLFVPRWWHHNHNKALVAALVSLPVLVYVGGGMGDEGRHLLAEKAYEYAGFIVVIAALFVISGGIHIQGSLAGTPLVNTALLGIGAVLANLTGTTGASVLLIRPLLRANKRRKRVAHIVVFFIFIVANCGGLLTPIGDPPLLLGFL
ncbi:MAG TPA: sodium:proton antiporter, partial [Gemmatimonadales bacterium]|nr:sodium:proton antiporter [Gemmatimonadales bacterium]